MDPFDDKKCSVRFTPYNHGNRPAKRFIYSHDPLLVHPTTLTAVPGANALGEPKGDLVLGAIDRVAAVANVPANLDAEVSTDGPARAIRRHGSA